jgi:hypothetical protein
LSNFYTNTALDKVQKKEIYIRTSQNIVKALEGLENPPRILRKITMYFQRSPKVLSSFRTLKLAGRKSGERRRGDSGYEANSYIKARDVSKKYQSLIHRPLEY